MSPLYTAFDGKTRIASGDLRQVALHCKAVLEQNDRAQVLIFNDLTGGVVDLDFRRLPEQAPPEDDAAPRRPGRPKLGVVAREVTLLPRHWEWLADQPGGASVALRKLVEQAIKTNRGRDGVRRAQDATYRFMSAMAGNEPGFEEALRALFGGQRARFHALMEPWPKDIREHVTKLAAAAFSEETE